MPPLKWGDDKESLAYVFDSLLITQC